MIGKKLYDEKNLQDDQKILDYIQKESPEDYDAILQADESWSAQLRLTPMRASLLEWYPLEKDANVLEAGGAFGELTHVLCEKCAHVLSVERELSRVQAIQSRCRNKQNLTVCNCDLMDLCPERNYDYVLAAGILESQGVLSKNLKDYADFVKRLCAFLKPFGKLLLICQNRMGIRYLCGEPDRKTGIPYDGVNGYPVDHGLSGFTKKELEIILDKAGIRNYQFYYPLPDDQMVQAVYAQDCLPKDSVKDRVISYYPDKYTVVASQSDFMDFCIESGCLHVFANSFFVECVPDGGACTDIHSVLFTTDRGKEAAMATIHKGNFMYKKALHPQGMKALKRSVDHAQDLQCHGIMIVPHEIMADGQVRMPYMELPLLLSVLRKAAVEDATLFVSLLDQVWQEIRSSSEEADGTQHPLRQQWNEEDWGIFLKNVYFDMVPMNCFYEKGQLIYFDQEFVRHVYPAKYTMFRVLLYTYLHIPQAETAVSKAAMLRRYGISSVMWDVFFQEEAAFISSLRKHQVFQRFHEMSQVSYEQMRENAAKLVQNHTNKCNGNKEDL